MPPPLVRRCSPPSPTANSSSTFKELRLLQASSSSTSATLSHQESPPPRGVWDTPVLHLSSALSLGNHYDKSALCLPHSSLRARFGLSYLFKKFIGLPWVLVAMCRLSSLTRDETQAPYIGSVESQLLDQEGSPLMYLFLSSDAGFHGSRMFAE